MNKVRLEAGNFFFFSCDTWRCMSTVLRPNFLLCAQACVYSFMIPFESQKMAGWPSIFCIGMIHRFLVMYKVWFSSTSIAVEEPIKFASSVIYSYQVKCCSSGCMLARCTVGHRLTGPGSLPAGCKLYKLCLVLTWNYEEVLTWLDRYREIYKPRSLCDSILIWIPG